jgi:hypothetical protein
MKDATLTSLEVAILVICLFEAMEPDRGSIM